MSNLLEFDVVFTVHAKIRIHEAVISAVDAEWKEMFYELNTTNEIIEMITSNLLQGSKLSQLDGFANLPDNYAMMVDTSYELDSVEEI